MKYKFVEVHDWRKNKKRFREDGWDVFPMLIPTGRDCTQDETYVRPYVTLCKSA